MQNRRYQPVQVLEWHMVFQSMPRHILRRFIFYVSKVQLKLSDMHEHCYKLLVMFSEQ